LKRDITLREVLEVAIGFEHAAHRFYLELDKHVADEVRPLVQELAREEQRHHELLVQLAHDESLADKLALSRVTPGPADASFRAYVTLPTLGDDPDVDQLLDYAAARERVAHEHYAYLAEVASPGPVQALFSLLRDEEQRHESFVQRRWTETFSAL
jgi:rubrerythrin